MEDFDAADDAFTDDANQVLGLVFDEVLRQRVLWGEQNHPDGTGAPGMDGLADVVKEDNQQRVESGELTFLDILNEEFLEAAAEADPTRLKEELIQVAAVAVTWVMAIDRRGNG